MHAEGITELREALAERDSAREVLECADARVRSAMVTLKSHGATLAEIAAETGTSVQAVSRLLKRQDGRDRRAWESEQESQRWDRWAHREQLADERGLEHGAIPCEHCGRFKPRPSAECEFCGSTRLTHNGDAHSLDRSYGYAA